MESKRERRIQWHAWAIAWREFGIRRRGMRFVISYIAVSPHFDDFADEIDDAKENGLITAEQAYDLLGASAIIEGIRESDEKPCYLLAEATWDLVERDVAESDIIIAANLASILSAATGAHVTAVAIGDGVSERDRRLAERSGVEVSLLWGEEERDAARRQELKDAAARLSPPSGRL